MSQPGTTVALKQLASAIASNSSAVLTSTQVDALIKAFTTALTTSSSSTPPGTTAAAQNGTLLTSSAVSDSSNENGPQLQYLGFLSLLMIPIIGLIRQFEARDRSVGPAGAAAGAVPVQAAQNENTWVSYWWNTLNQFDPSRYTGDA
ncbi:MAG: hypothetical protein EBZ47_08310 [Chlamydiae bacterium]|nr:hypothetical protein [Chlamydiota bacterium]